MLVLMGACSSSNAAGGSGANGSGTGTSAGRGTGTSTTSSSGAGAASGTSGGMGGASSAGGTSATAQSGGGASSVTTTTGAGGGNGGTGGSTEPPVTEEEYPFPANAPNEDGSELWLRYPEMPLPMGLAAYQAALTHVVSSGASPTLQAAEAELVRGIGGITGLQIPVSADPTGPGAVVIGTPEGSAIIAEFADRLTGLGDEGYLVEAADLAGQSGIIVAANSDLGVLYGSFALLRQLQMHRSLDGLSLSSAPRIQHRLLDHWDNLDGTIERGYAGGSLWDWNALPGSLSPRYETYARANASIGINGAVLNNVNADAEILNANYLAKVAALADVFRPYGIRVYLTARFSAPIEIGGLSTADPLDAGVAQWWVDKADEIYALIPDFGGFLVKANSEGQPGPGDYGRTHADGANMLADALAPHGGIVMWRAFVYSENSDVDRIRQAYEEFEPLDGQFRDNVLVQPKNGPLDFQPREPFHPLFGAMPETPLALELQITKEYLGEDTHLVYLGPLYQEVLQSDTYASGAGSTVARVVDGSLHGYATTAIAGVSNVGSDSNWTGSHFNQANWYVFGRMAWNPDAPAEGIAEEWVRQTLSNDPMVVEPVTQMMMMSRQALVDYMTPLGLAHIMGSDHHYGPAPWVSDLSRPEWNPVYYHRADAQGIGFDRTATGSNAVEQYFAEVGSVFGDRASIPDDFLLFFHHVGWQETMSSGRTLWEELVYRYSFGVDQVGVMRDTWATVQDRIDAQRFGEVNDFLQIQHYEARWWRDACLQYFRTFSNLDIPAGYAQPAHDLAFYEGLSCPSDVTKPRCNDVYTGEPSPAILQ